jgi:hypothetical protein
MNYFQKKYHFSFMRLKISTLFVTPFHKKIGRKIEIGYLHRPPTMIINQNLKLTTD